MRVFVAVGTHEKPFNRLIRAVDEIAESQKNIEFFVQTGNSTYVPKHCKFKKFLSPEQYEEEIKKADVVVSHSGAGSIISALANKKPLIIVPRLKKYDEHTDDHQLDIANALERMNKAKVVCDMENLCEALLNAKKTCSKMQSSRQRLIARIKKFLDECDEKKKNR
ncbi:MAG: glycosyl transferase [Candidatus Diapherotrites archaeon]|nr:glycosyl transferase [Candidatus Diapherotrites archaeon]